jgi:Flp pilus assembly protein TadD
VQAPDEEEGESQGSVDRVSRWGRERVVLAAIAVPVLIVTVTSLIGDRLILSSQADARSGDLPSALSAAEDAASFQPYAATPHLQQALVLQLQHNLDAAAAQASEATRLESTDWRTWYALSQIERDQGDKSAAAATYDHARSLNPRSPVFTGEPAPGTAPPPSP